VAAVFSPSKAAVFSLVGPDKRIIGNSNLAKKIPRPFLWLYRTDDPCVSTGFDGNRALFGGELFGQPQSHEIAGFEDF
jgi:hypothetical protein